MTKVPPTSDVKNHQRALSKILFGGARYRLEIAAAIGDSSDGVVSTPELAEDLSVVAQSVNQELRILERAGLLARHQRLRGDRQVFYQRQESSFWRFCVEARDDATAMLERGSPW